MKARYAILIFTVLAAAAIGSSTSARAQDATPATAATTANTPADTAATALAKKVYNQLASGSIDRSLLTIEMNNALSPEQIKSVVPQLKAFGGPVSLTITKKTSIAGGTAYQFAVKFPQEEHHIEMFLDAKGLVGGFFVRP